MLLELFDFVVRVLVFRIVLSERLDFRLQFPDFLLKGESLVFEVKPVPFLVLLLLEADLEIEQTVAKCS